MKKSHILIAVLGSAAVLLATAFQARANIIGGPDIIPAPPSVINNPPGAVNDHQQGFNERQDVLLPADLGVDGGVISSGTLVNSHMIFLNIVGTVETSDVETWLFDGPILGVMSDINGTLEAASSALLGAPGTIYPAGFPNRGLEGADNYLVAGNALVLRDSVTQPGDWIRVVTAAKPVPDSSTGFWGLAAVVIILGVARQRYLSMP